MKSALNDLAAVAVAAVALCATTMLYGQGPATATQPMMESSKPAEPKSTEKLETTDLHLIELKYADAGNLAELLANVLGPGSSRKGTPIAIIPDRRTNQLIITATKSDFEAIEALALKLDVPAPQRPTGSDEPSTESRLPSASPRRGVTSSGRSATAGGRGGRGILSAGGGSTDGNATSAEGEKFEPATPEVRVFQIKNADVADLSEVLRQTFNHVFATPGSNIEWNTKGPLGSDLIVTVPKVDMPKVEMLIKRLDIPPTVANTVSANPFQPPGAPWADVNGVTGGGFGRSGGFSGTTGGFGGTASTDGGSGFAGRLGGPIPEPQTAIINDLKNAREYAEAAAKQADANAKKISQEMTELLKQAAASAKDNKSDMTAQLLERIDQLVADQQKAAERQHLAVEKAARIAEAQLNDYRRALGQPLAKSWGSGIWETSPKDPEAAKLDAQTQHLIESYRTLMLSTWSTPEQEKQLDAKGAETKEQLRKLLNEQFEQREKSQSGELDQLRQRLDKLEKELSDRKNNRESLIDRRMNDLLSTNSTATPMRKTDGAPVVADGLVAPNRGILPDNVKTVDLVPVADTQDAADAAPQAGATATFPKAPLPPSDNPFSNPTKR